MFCPICKTVPGILIDSNTLQLAKAASEIVESPLLKTIDDRSEQPLNTFLGSSPQPLPNVTFSNFVFSAKQDSPIVVTLFGILMEDTALL